uniref:Cordon-bleu ubiquitin-like domain-containing protein n=1 Tax=Ciona savignyi TaxID=51511 RepID=H2YMX7_CIOSA
MTEAQKRTSTTDDDVYLSEDSETTQGTTGSDLDYDLTLQVVLPDSSTTTTHIPASTPLSDLRAILCSKFKLSPSSHIVDFVTDSAKNGPSRRKASLAVGKMEISLVKIQAKKEGNPEGKSQPKHAIAPQNTVRLLVHLARMQQSIVRVCPDAPLAQIFHVICDKLNISSDSRHSYHLVHPKQPQSDLDLKHSLNFYHLREINLMEKKDPTHKKPPPPVRNKRKAPLPPGVPSPRHTSPPPRPAPPHHAAPPNQICPP